MVVVVNLHEVLLTMGATGGPLSLVCLEPVVAILGF